MSKKPYIIELPKFLDDRGNLSFIEESKDIPFDIARVHWIYDVPGNESRGGHAFRKNNEFIVALSGSFDVLVNTGEEELIFSLNRSYQGLFIPHGCWRQMKNFSTNSFALIISSEPFDKADYIYDFEEILR